MHQPGHKIAFLHPERLVGVDQRAVHLSVGRDGKKRRAEHQKARREKRRQRAKQSGAERERRSRAKRRRQQHRKPQRQPVPHRQKGGQPQAQPAEQLPDLSFVKSVVPFFEKENGASPLGRFAPRSLLFRWKPSLFGKSLFFFEESLLSKPLRIVRENT